MLKKIVTTVGLVSVFGASTIMAADVNLSAATFTPYKVASETKNTANKTSGTGVNASKSFFDIEKGANLDLDVAITTGFVGNVTGADDYFVRVDLTNAAYATIAEAIVITPLRNNNYGNNGKNGTVSLFSGGAVGSSKAVYRFDITGSLTATATLNATFTNLATSGNPKVTMSIFETLTEANNAAGSPITTANKTLVNFSPGLKRTVAAKNQTVEVSSGFKKYLAGSVTSTLGQLGSTVHAVNAGLVDGGDGLTAILTDLYTASTTVATVSGDLSNGVWWMDAGACLSFAAIAKGDKLTLNAAKTSGTTTGTVLDAKKNLCNLADGTTTIPSGAYSLAINYTPGTIATTAGAADVTGLNLGKITRNGTTQQINYLTTFASYNQRVYITNRGSTDATYTFTFQTEDGTTATAGTAATGTSKAASVLALKAADIVTLAGKTRTAATLAIVGAPGNFGISTQQVNLSNGATDTVVYKGGATTGN